MVRLKKILLMIHPYSLKIWRDLNSLKKLLLAKIEGKDSF